MSIIVILMTAAGFVGGILSHNIVLIKDAQKECYSWLEEQCPCVFQSQPGAMIPTLNLTLGGQNVVLQKENTS
jgi:hypothetical protein